MWTPSISKYYMTQYEECKCINLAYTNICYDQCPNDPALATRLAQVRADMVPQCQRVGINPAAPPRGSWIQPARSTSVSRPSSTANSRPPSCKLQPQVCNTLGCSDSTDYGGIIKITSPAPLTSFYLNERISISWSY